MEMVVKLFRICNQWYFSKKNKLELEGVLLVSGLKKVGSKKVTPFVRLWNKQKSFKMWKWLKVDQDTSYVVPSL